MLPPLPPLATTGGASAVGLTNATATGTVNPRGGPISACRFEYLAHSDFLAGGYVGARSVPCTPASPSGAVAIPVSAALSNLVPGTTYDYRLVSTNNVGTANGAEATFATLAEDCPAGPAACHAPPASGSPAPVQSPPTPPSTTAPAARAPASAKCRKGFQKKRVKGKQRCVKVKKKRNRSAGG